MGSIFDLCASRKTTGVESITVESPTDQAFLRRYPNAVATSVTLPSGLKVPPRQWGKDWVIKSDRIVLERRNSGDIGENYAPFILLIAPNDVGFAKASKGKVCSGITLPSGLKVPERKNGKEWVFDDEAVVLR